MSNEDHNPNNPPQEIRDLNQPTNQPLPQYYAAPPQAVYGQPQMQAAPQSMYGQPQQMPPQQQLYYTPAGQPVYYYAPAPATGAPGAYPTYAAQPTPSAIPLQSDVQGMTVQSTPRPPEPVPPPAGHHRPGHQKDWGEQDWMVPEDKLLNADVDIKIRHGFIRKVYGILSVQLIITFGIALIFNLSEPAANWWYDNYYISIILSVVFMCVVCGLTCVPGVARKTPINYILLLILSLCMGGILGVCTGAVDTWAFSVAVGTTAGIVVLLTLFACQTKWDFTGCGAFGFTAFMILIMFSLMAAIAHNNVMDMLYGCIGAMIFSCFLVHDTQKIVGGKHRKYQYGIDDYCFAALSLYLDVINLFMYILTIISAAERMG